MKIRTQLPLILFIFVALILWRGLSLHAETIPSTLIGKQAPAFDLPLLATPKIHITDSVFRGRVTVLNSWSTTCIACAEEHPFLMSIAHQPGYQLIGLSYLDLPADIKIWLVKNGNPYDIVLADQTGDIAIDWGVYGTPETFIIDKKGRIRFRQPGAMDEILWENTILPLIHQLQQER